MPKLPLTEYKIAHYASNALMPADDKALVVELVMGSDDYIAGSATGFTETPIGKMYWSWRKPNELAICLAEDN
jgi:hypothetical protein